MEQHIARTPKGTPAGGQFAEHDRADTNVTLDDPTACSRRFLSVIGTMRDSASTASAFSYLIDEAARDLVPAGSVIAFERGWYDDSFKLDAVTLPGGETAPEAAIAALTARIGFVCDEPAEIIEEHFEYVDSDGGERRIVRVGEPDVTPREKARLAVTFATAEAGLGGIMTGVFEGLIDRADGDEQLLARYAAVTAEQVTDLYESVFGPALDAAEDRIAEGTI